MSDLSFWNKIFKFILLLLGSYLYLHTSFLLYKGQIWKFRIIIMQVLLVLLLSLIKYIFVGVGVWFSCIYVFS